MAAIRKTLVAPNPEVAAEVVLVPFAYAATRDGEVVQLRKGDIITDRFTDVSLDHLRSIGFVGAV